MTVQTTTNKIFAAGTGAITAFDFPFKYFNASDIDVYVNGVLVNTDDYTLSAAASGDGGTITFDTAPANLTTVLITRSLDYTQESSVPTVDKLSRGLLESIADKQVMLAQQLQETSERCLKIAFSQDVTPDTEITLTANKAVIVNTDGDGFTLGVDNYVDQAATAATSAAASASSASAASTSATSAASSASAASTSATSAAASATAAAGSAAQFTPASVTEALTGTDTSKQITPDALASLWERGSDIASATALAIPSTGGGYFVVTGTSAITSITGDLHAGRSVVLKFSGILTLTHNATSLILPGGASITTAAGDTAHFVCEDATSHYWRCVWYSKASGIAIVPTVTPVFTAYNLSSDIPIVTAGAWSVTHGLGSAPKGTQMWLKCTSADLGYATGDRVLVSPDNAHGSTDQGAGGVVFSGNTTTIDGRFGNTANTFFIMHATTGTRTQIAQANWVLQVATWA